MPPKFPPRPARLLHAALACLLLSPHSACKAAGRGAPPCAAPPPQIHLITSAAPQLNLGHDGEAWPLHLRIYQLAAAPRRPHDLSELHADDAALGAPVLRRDDRVIYPSDQITWHIDQEADATYIAALALFRQPAPAGWIQILQLPATDACAPSPLCLSLKLDRHLLSAAPLLDPACAPWRALGPQPQSSTQPPTKAPSPPSPSPPSPPSTPSPPATPSTPSTPSPL